MTRGTITITGAYGAGNLGDEAILAGILHALRKELPAYGLQVLSHDPAATAELHGVASASVIPAGLRSALTGLRRTRAALSNTKLVLIGGGGILYDGTFGRGRMNPIHTWWLRTELLRRWNIPYAFFAVGAGPITRRTSMAPLRRMLEGAAFVSARDSASVALLQSLVPRVTVLPIPDPAFALPPPPPQPIHRTVVSVRRWFADDPAREEAFHETLVAGLQPLVAAGEQVGFLPMVGNSEGDVALAEKLAGMLGHHAVALPLPRTPEDAIRTLAQARTIVAMRLHALILGAVAGRPIIPLAYSAKVASVAHELGLTPLDPATLTTEDLRAALERPRSPGLTAGERGMQFRHQARELIEGVLGTDE